MNVIWRDAAGDRPHVMTTEPERWKACFCTGPRPGDTKCPCAMEADGVREFAMFTDGIVIAGQRYKLVPADHTQ